MSRRLRLCILGCGSIASTHASVLRRWAPDVELLFASRSAERARNCCERWGGGGAFDSYEQACRSAEVDVVLLCTPNDQHADQARMALEAGHHVVVEKPMAGTLAQARQMNRTAHDAGRKLLVAENFRFRPSLRAVLPVVASGVLGTLKTLRIAVMTRSQPAAGQWRTQQRHMMGGPFIDGGIHWVHLLLTYGGGQALRLSAERSAHTQPHFNHEDTMTVLCRCANGLVATLTYSKGIAGTFKRKFHTLHGADGSLYLANNGLLGILRGRRGWVRPFPMWDRRGYGAMWAHLLDVLRHDAAPLVSGLEGARDVAFVEAAYASAASGRTQVLPTAAELA